MYSLHIGKTEKIFIILENKLCRYIHFLLNPHHGGEDQYSPDFGSLG